MPMFAFVLLCNAVNYNVHVYVLIYFVHLNVCFRDPMF